MSDLQRYPLNLCLIKYAQDIQDIIEIVVFQALRGFVLSASETKEKLSELSTF